MVARGGTWCGSILVADRNIGALKHS
jgi:hypothetical protein